MNESFPELNLEKFAHGYDSFFDAAIYCLQNADNDGVLIHLLPENIRSQYRFSDQFRSGQKVMRFLSQTYISRDDKEGFVSFLNSVLPQAVGYLKLNTYQKRDVHENLPVHLSKFIDLVAATQTKDVFSLDFEFDTKSRIFKRKIDAITIETINANDAALSGDNKLRYEECVNEFLSYKRGVGTDKLFYNESLNRLKRVVENTLETGYRRDDGGFPKISNAEQISNILFDSSNPEFESVIKYVVSKVHHDSGGQPNVFNEKEYFYLWLELNKILFLLNKYKK